MGKVRPVCVCLMTRNCHGNLSTLTKCLSPFLFKDCKSKRVIRDFWERQELKLHEEKVKRRTLVAETEVIAKVQELQHIPMRRVMCSLLIPVSHTQAAQHITIASAATEQIQGYALSTTASNAKRFLNREEGSEAC
ncbi:hypothetical protein BC936DRAFT_140431 [Jimgerdemannia flammicorona]|uniref:Uncharacterized protein n=1 Tax=Jimgerdemannia flammicorona TaxID=994334 RepID=A0A433ATY0_9FUNG|nr:hypothetical protein BC936DRAFT_140431 [Jimgerdemannia flammicorona]